LIPALENPIRIAPNPANIHSVVSICKLSSIKYLNFQENCFESLDAPVRTIGSENMPAIPLNSVLEQTMIPSTEKVKAKIEEILNY